MGLRAGWWEQPRVDGVKVGANEMASSVGRDRGAERSGGESCSSGGCDTFNGTFARGTTAFHDRRLLTMTGSRNEVPAAEGQENEHLSPGFAAWKLGHELVDRREYERAAECFRGMLLSADAPVDRSFFQAAELTAQLCAAFGSVELSAFEN